MISQQPTTVTARFPLRYSRTHQAQECPSRWRHRSGFKAVTEPRQRSSLLTDEAGGNTSLSRGFGSFAACRNRHRFPKESKNDSLRCTHRDRKSATLKDEWTCREIWQQKKERRFASSSGFRKRPTHQNLPAFGITCAFVQVQQVATLPYLIVFVVRKSIKSA